MNFVKFVQIGILCIEETKLHDSFSDSHFLEGIETVEEGGSCFINKGLIVHRLK